MRVSNASRTTQQQNPEDHQQDTDPKHTQRQLIGNERTDEDREPDTTDEDVGLRAATIASGEISKLARIEIRFRSQQLT